MSEREKIIIELDKLVEHASYADCEAFYNWHLAEVARIVEPLVIALKKANNTDCVFEQCDIYEEAINETLKRANGGENGR